MNSESEQFETLPPGSGNVATPSGPDTTPGVPSVAIEPPKRSWLRRFWPGLLLVFLLALTGLLAWQHNLVTDWLVTRGYHVPSSIKTLAQDDTMTAYAKRLFYVNRPQIEDRGAFNRNCSNYTDQVTVLGCYTGNRQGIYVYDVTDPRLSGIQQVTAAHEMLHQAYDRLSSSERTRINDLLVAYSKTITDPALKAKLASYQKIEPHDVVNEMHSVFGTEVSDLPPQLEQYYAQYFTNRHKITKYHDQYQAAFTQRQQQIDSYDTQIDTLKQQIDADKAEIDAREKSLQAQRAQLNSYISSNQVAAYNAAVPGFNSQVDAYKTLIGQTNTLIDQYNKLIDARNTIAVQEQQLQQAIDSHANTAAKQ